MNSKEEIAYSRRIGWKTKGLHKLCSVFEGVQERFIFIIYTYV